MVLAPQLSALRTQFDRSDLEVVAGYMETCDGTPDHAAGVRAEVAAHTLEYPVLDVEAGRMDDPTSERYPWAPRAVVLDRAGRVVLGVPHMPAMKTLAADLTSIVESGRVDPAPDHAWRDFSKGAWVTVRVDDGDGSRTVKQTLGSASRTGVSITSVTESVPTAAATTKRALSSRPKLHDDRERVWKQLADEVLTVDERKYPCRVSETSWTRVLERGASQTFTQRSWVADDPTLPETLLRRTTTRRSAGGGDITWTQRVRSFDASRNVGDEELACWVVERTSAWDGGSTATTSWLSTAVPGHVVREESVTRSHGLKSTTSREAVAFAAKP